MDSSYFQIDPNPRIAELQSGSIYMYAAITLVRSYEGYVISLDLTNLMNYS